MSGGPGKEGHAKAALGELHTYVQHVEVGSLRRRDGPSSPSCWLIAFLECDRSPCQFSLPVPVPYRSSAVWLMIVHMQSSQQKNMFKRQEKQKVEKNWYAGPSGDSATEVLPCPVFVGLPPLIPSRLLRPQPSKLQTQKQRSSCGWPCSAANRQTR